MGPKTLLLVLVLGCSFSENLCKSLPRKNFADIIKGMPDKFVESHQSRALGWPAAPATPRGLLPFYMIAEYIIDAYSGGGLKGKLQALQKSCTVRALGVLIIPVLLAIIAALAIIVLQVVNIILTALVLATNFGVALTGKKLGLPKFGNFTADEPEQCNSQLLRLIRHDCEYQARDLTMVELGGKQYYFSHDSIKMPMEEARDFCRSRCQQLVSVEDPAEETELFGYLTKMGEGEIEPFWTSGSYKNGKYKWLATGRDFGYIQLAPPRQQQRSVDSSCVGMASVRNETAWIGAPCQQANRFICEKPVQLAYKDHFLYGQMKAEEEAEAAAEAATASTAAESVETTTEQSVPLSVVTNEIRRRWG